MPTTAVNPAGSAADIIQQLYGYGPSAASQWLDQNATTMDPDTARTVLSYFAQQPSQGGGSYIGDVGRSRLEALGGPVQAAGDAAQKQQANLDTLAQQAIANAGQGQPTTGDLNKDGKVSTAEVDALHRAQTTMSSGQDAATKDAVKAAAGQVNTQASVPWSKALLSYVGGNANLLDPTTVHRIVETWNQQNPHDKLPNDDLVALNSKLADPNNPAVAGALDSVFYGQDPAITYSIRLPDGRQEIVDADQYKAFHSVYQIQSGDLTSLVRVADRTGLKDDNGRSMAPVLASLVRAHRDGTFTVQGAGGGQMAGEAARASATTDVNVSGQLSGVANAHNTRGGQYYTDAKGNPTQARDEAGMLPLQHTALTQMSLKYQEGKTLYGGNDELAFVHTMDPVLASKLAAGQANEQDLHKYQTLIVAGNFDQKAFSQMGTYVSTLADYGVTQKSARGGGSVRSIPDQDALRQAAKDMYRQLFAADPTDAELNGLVAGVNSAVAGAGSHQSVDPQAKLRAALEANPHYADLYGKMPGGMTESDYQGQFQAASRSLLGNTAADPPALQGGMRTGDVQTTLGQITAQKSSFNNSTFMARLAAAAQTVNENT